jgi:hypothetical protein
VRIDTGPKDSVQVQIRTEYPVYLRGCVLAKGNLFKTKPEQIICIASRKQGKMPVIPNFKGALKN